MRTVVKLVAVASVVSVAWQTVGKLPGFSPEWFSQLKPNANR